jgi:hypothetical protein
MKVGVHGRNDFWSGAFTESDYQAIRNAKIEMVKTLSYIRLDVYRRLREENPGIDFIVRLEDQGTHDTPAEFVVRHAPRIAELRPYAQKFEILNEPNYPGWGWGPTLEHAKAFNQWFAEVVDRLKERFPWAECGFPGLSPKMLADNPYDDLEWIQKCSDAVAKSDWLGCHCYWFDEHAVLHPAFGLRFTQYHSLFPNKTIHITEFNGSPTIPPWEMAQHYASYYKKIADYPYVGSASAFILSSLDRTFFSLAWWDPNDGQMRPVVWAVGQIPRPLGGPPGRPTYAVEYVSHNTPTTMVAGQVNATHITIRNRGGKTWAASGYNQVRLGYHWHYADNSLVPSSLWADLRTALPHDVAPDDMVALVAEVGAPRAQGNYILKWDMVEEMVTWFAWQRVPTLDVAITIQPGAEPPPPTGMTVSASDNNVNSGADNLQQALDGNAYTRWSSRRPQSPGMWFQIDLGETRTVAQVRLDNAASPRDYPRGYILRLSVDGQHWETVDTQPNNQGPLSVSFPPRLARYIRIEQAGSDPFYWWSIHEITVSSEAAMSATASHNNRMFGADNVMQALDDRPETRWSTMAVQTPGMWFELDLGQIRTIRGIALDNAGSPNDYPRGYIVKVSLDRARWDEVAARRDNNAPLDVSFSLRQVRYIRMEQTGSSDRWWWSIHRIELKA